MVLSIPSWSIPYKKYSKFMSFIVDSIAYSQKAGITKLVVIQFNNEGGDRFLRQFFMEVLWPNIFPPEYVSQIPLTDIDHLSFKDAHTTPTGIEATLPDNYTHIDIMNSPPYDFKTFTGKGNLSGHSRTRQYTKRHLFLQKYTYNYVYPIRKIPQVLRQKPLFSPQNIIFVTDGLCTSACAFLTKWVKQRKLGKVIGIGAVLDNPNNVEYDSGTAASGPLRKLSGVIEQGKHSSVTYKLPQAFPRSGTDASFAAQIVYSAAQGEENVMNEFNIVPPDAVLRIFPNPLKNNQREIMSEIAQNVQQYFNRCFDWEVSSNSTCTAPTNGTQIANADYGNPCQNGTFDTSKCVFRACSQGCYLSSDGNTCLVSPIYQYVDRTFWEKFLSVGGEFILVAIVVIIITGSIFLCCCCYRNKQKQKSKDVEENGAYTQLTEKV